ncbi:MAG TPA: hypothetical protein DDX54_07250 [Rhodospirillaceae bacterium]|jgi:hypothetical protein|nr:hypothetical protein [Alphaproteobacteria bacterium]HBH27169.1 hypothetical protein [Rhodospirillaceae bacterium]
MPHFLVFALCLLAGPALACNCVMPTACSSQEVIGKAYAIVRARVEGVTYLAQNGGIVQKHAWSPVRVDMEVLTVYKGYIEPGPLAVDMQRDLNNCDMWDLTVGSVQDLIVFRDGAGALYVPNTCVGLTPEAWERLQTSSTPEDRAS